MANLIDVTRQFSSEDACHDYLANLRWPGGVRCLRCRGARVTKFQAKGRRGTVRRLYQCNTCRHQFSATTGTLFHDSHLPLAKWFLAIAIITDAKKSVSALQMQRHLKVAYRTAWYLCHRIRAAMQDSTDSIFTGTVEVDETYIGGRYDKRRSRKPFEKDIVVGVVKRTQGEDLSQVQAFHVPNTGKAALVGVVRSRVSLDAELVCTDESRAYRSLRKIGYSHASVNHSALEYARGPVHTNNIENFWSLFKRGLVGSFHKVSIKHLHRYLDEFTCRFNGRGSDLFTPTLIGLLHTEGMPYKRLIATEPA